MKEKCARGDMNMIKKKLKDLTDRIRRIDYEDEAELENCKTLFSLYCEIEGDTLKKFENSVNKIPFHDNSNLMSDRRTWQTGKARFAGVVEAAGEAIELNELVSVQKEKKYMKIDNRKVFIVHGHDEALKYKVSNWLRELDITPIILHEQANKGVAAIIQKIENNSDVGCAIILMTGDDMGRAVEEKKNKKRARQNVVFEAGYFIGKLGTERVIILEEEGIESPGDLEGCVYIIADKHDGWKVSVKKEFEEIGIQCKK